MGVREQHAAALVGASRSRAALDRKLRASSGLNISVLLTGPTGAGKTHAARLLHEYSGVAGRFVHVNCSHLTDERAMVDLFGARAGAYTGLTSGREGHIEEARGGTLFLDEVSELPASVQAQVLMLLQERTWRRVGDTVTRRARDVRFVSATNADLDALAASGDFRPDLLHRLNQFRVNISGLDQRPEDVAPLARHLIARLCRDLGLPTLQLGVDALALLKARRWPGNVRELENVLREAIVWAHWDGAKHVGAGHFHRKGEPEEEERKALPMKHAVAQFKSDYAKGVLVQCKGNRNEAARRLEISRSHLYQLLG